MCTYIYMYVNIHACMHTYIYIVFECISHRPATITLPPLPAATMFLLGMAAATTVRHCLKLGEDDHLPSSKTAAQVPAGHSSLWFETAPTCDSGLGLWLMAWGWCEGI